MIEIESKSLRQEESIKKWKAAKGLGTLNLVPRFGKTRIATLVSERSLFSNPNIKIVAVAHNDIAHKNLVNNLPAKVIITTASKIVKEFEEYKLKKIDLLIVDEIHRFFRGNNLLILKLEPKWKLGLTGAKLTVFEKAILKQNGFQVVDTITEDEALDNHWISEFVEYNLPVEIEEHKKAIYASYSSKITSILDIYRDKYKRMNIVLGMKIFVSDLALMYGMYSGINFKIPNTNKSVRIHPDTIRHKLAETMGWNRELDMSIDMNKNINTYFNPAALHEAAQVLNGIIRERNELIINSRNKVDAVVEIINRNPVPTIIFSESTQMASDIARVLGDDAIEYHSGIESCYIMNPKTGEYYSHANGNPIKFGATRLKKFAIECIMNGSFKYLCTVKALNESVDIPILQQVITTGGTTNPSTHLQRIARGKTLDSNNLGKVTSIINVYIKDFIMDDVLIPSRDASKLKTRQAESVVFWVDTIDEIFNDVL